VKLRTPFAPIVPGEIDDFAFDHTPDMGNSTLTSATWTCAFAPRGHDPAPQSRILATRMATRINVRSPIDGTLQMRSGYFTIATVGNVPASAAGGTYTLEVQVDVTDPDGHVRELDLSADIPCQAMAS
jgi:hypothetical protein